LLFFVHPYLPFLVHCNFPLTKAFVPSKDLLDQIAISSLEYLNQLEL